jgi:hypothetical protein
MTLDTRIAMALAVQAHKGVYALLLGSGISRSAGIPTGWEVVMDLAERVAAAEGADTGGNPEQWYRKRFRKEPAYSDVVKMLAPKRAERQSLLKPYFEPTEEEREQEKKQPTPAHRALAQLVSKGYIRVIITTNFDRLMERALEEMGVSPTVVSTPDQVAGMMPPQHTNCLLVKIHGDYLDTRLRNTADELEKYEPKTNVLLSRILTEYGLIVCGWSAEWDTALCDAITKATTHRFSTFWMQKGEAAAKTIALQAHRQAVVVKIDSADEVFTDVLTKIDAIESRSLGDPLSPTLASATAKRYLSEPRFHIQLEDLIVRETKTLRRRTSHTELSCQDEHPDNDSIPKRVAQIETASNVMLSIVAAVAKWGEPRTHPLISRCLSALAELEQVGGDPVWLDLRRYPAALIFFAVGTVALSTRNDDLSRHLLSELYALNERGKRILLAQVLDLRRVLDHDAAQTLFPKPRRTPVSDRVASTLQIALNDFFDSPQLFDSAYDRFEIALSMAIAMTGEPPPSGRYCWKHRHHESQTFSQFMDEIKTEDISHPIAQAIGCTDSTLLAASLESVKRMMSSERWW